jgi:hypothetical protein
MAEPLDTPPLEEPLAELERSLIDEFLRSAGRDPVQVRAQHDAQSRELLIAASTYAAARLTEVETRAHYVRSLRGEV